jgi:4-diphosphocytidyl-2C-methyl-D-erythritol kinase
VSGAGSAVYGLFERRAQAEAVAEEMSRSGEIWITEPAW